MMIACASALWSMHLFVLDRPGAPKTNGKHLPTLVTWASIIVSINPVSRHTVERHFLQYIRYSNEITQFVHLFTDIIRFCRAARRRMLLNIDDFGCRRENPMNKLVKDKIKRYYGYGFMSDLFVGRSSYKQYLVRSRNLFYRTLNNHFNQ